ncbi:TPA: minor capsid protein [Streptococcus suis]|nr:minor capsid protein [Streptococcus suis]
MVNDYWKKRIEAEQLAKMERGATLGEEMDRLYSYHFNELEKEIRAFEQRYADKNGLSLSEVKARVDDFDVKSFEEKAKRYVAEKNFSARANSELALYNLKMKTNRLALLQHQLDLELVALAEDERQLTERFLNDEFIKVIETQSGLLGQSVLSASQIKTVAQSVLNTPFEGIVWSERIWQRQNALREVVARMTERLLLQGKNPTTMVSQIRKEFGVSASEAKRLAVTEGARVATEGQKRAYIANGYDEYEFIAEPSACPNCAKLDGKIFKVKDMIPGENAAPMHPWCHCSTGAHADDKADQKQIAGIDVSKQDVKDGLSSLRQGAIDAVRKTNMLDSVGLENYNQFLDRFDIIEDEQLLKIYRKFGSEIEYRKLKGTSDFAIGSRVQLTQSAFDGKRVQGSLLYSNNPLSTVFHENGHAFDSLGLKILTKDKRVVIGEKEVKMFREKTKVSIFARHASALPEYDLKNAIRKDLWGYVNGDLPLLNDPNYSYKRGEKTKIRTKAIENFANFKTEMLELQKTQPNVVGNISDMVEATGWLGEYPFGDGHGKKYWEDLGSAETEFFAEVSSLVATDIEGYEEVKRIFPNAVAIYHRIVDDILGGIE